MVGTTATAHLPHPSKAQLQDALTTYPASPAKERNPHDVPTFDSQSLTSPKAPVLYLPPLLSSLPETTDRVEEDQLDKLEFPPLVTETRLPDIDPASLSLHRALHRFRPLTSDSAATPYPEAFNWSELSLPEDEERDWYCVVFWSKRKAGSDSGCKFFDLISFSEIVLIRSILSII